MCPSCASRNPGFFVPAMVFLLGKRQLEDIFWIPAFAGMTPFSRLRFALEPSLPAKGRGELLLSAKLLQKAIAPPDRDP